MLHPVILSGGTGNRLWPLSRALYPKQLLSLIGKGSLLQQTAKRIQEVTENASPIVISNQNHRFIVKQQLQECGITPSALLLEPVGRNTAPAIAVAALQALANDAQAMLWVLPADHLITDTSALHQALDHACAIAEQGYCVTFGIVPSYPATAYGYIQPGDSLDNGFRIATFQEKPDEATATQCIAQGFLWNSGMFVLPAQLFLDELQKFNPDIYQHAKAALDSKTEDLEFTLLDPTHFTLCPDDSIDYAVMEKTDKAAVVPLECGWCDLGSWQSLADISPKDEANNVLQGDVIALKTQNSYIRADSRLVTTLGVSNQIIVETADAVLIADKAYSEDVKALVNELKHHDRSEALSHTRVYRPWGYYETLQISQGFQVKRLMVKPGGLLSLQKHCHRSEHWVVVHGVADVTKGEQQLQLNANESTYIPIGCMHRLGNTQTHPLEVIEVQTGDYLGEDDIIRFEDNYARI